MCDLLCHHLQVNLTLAKVSLKIYFAFKMFRYIPIPEPVQMSVYASWYKKTYPDQVVGCAAMSNEGLVTVDNAGTVRLWETGTANLQESLQQWRRMIGDDVSLSKVSIILLDIRRVFKWFD